MTEIIPTRGPLNTALPNVSALAFGCMGLGGGWDSNDIGAAQVAQAHSAIDAALEAGINFFDHADIYTRGKAERVFGEVLRQRPGLREQIYLQSKCGIRFEDGNGPKRYDFSRAWITQSVEGILQRLGVDYLDILLLHRPDPLMEAAEIAEVFAGLKAAGKVRHFGVSNMQAAQMAHLQRHLDGPLVVNQIEISLKQLAWLDEQVTAGNPVGRDVNFSSGTLEYCQAQGVQVQSWGSLCQGLFSGCELHGQPESVRATAELVAHMAEIQGVSREAIVLAWLLRHPAGVQPVIGTTQAERLRACAEALKISLSREAWYRLYVTARGAELP